MELSDNAGKEESALKVNEGIPQPAAISPNALERFKQKQQPLLSADEFARGILMGNRVILSKAITLIESVNPAHNSLAQEVIEQCLPYSGKSVRIGITGVPGVGKSTFIEALGKHVTALGHKLAVLAIDPSSSRTKGSILGDKTRMEELSTDENAFIRPSPSAGSLGGVARKTKESIILCEAAGFDVIFVETVGVGQSEIAVHSMVDFFLLLMLAGAGDELQGIKRGIMEMADAIFINKADGDNRQKASQAKMEYKNALHLFPPPESGWTPVTGLCSALSKEGIPEVWEVIGKYQVLTKENGYFDQKRLQQKSLIMIETIKETLRNDFYSTEKIRQLLPLVETDMLNDKISSYVAAQKLIQVYFDEKKAI
ncbi:MAG: methylmalonyl Co-A mutase-associated GTPase MeaB [Bacteroidales bacterium]|nr:methylmalonyl Co-A mutase-associated GTPase MeaB [Bacteroidales bacterium]